MRKYRFHHNTSLAIVALVLIVCYYLADVAMDAWLFNEGSFFEQLLDPSLHEVAIRVLSSCFLLIFLATTTALMRKNRVLQSEILKQSQELLTAQRQLQDYNYAVSQQLRTTLTCISTAEQLLHEQLNDPKLDRALLGSIHDSSERMVGQIDHLENLSRARCNDLNQQQVSLDLLVREASAEMILKRNDLHIDIHLERSLKARCDRDLMLIAIRNLIQGLITFCHPAAHTTIVIGATSDPLRNTFFLRNDGHDFKHAEMMQLFRHDSDEPVLDNESEDTSPLALAKIIINRHGGKLWAASQPEPGACFFFTL